MEPQGDVPVLASGANEIDFTCEHEAGVTPRAYVSMITEGEPFDAVNPPDQNRAEFLPRMEEAVDRAVE